MAILSTELRIGNLVSENVLGISKVVGIIKSAAFLSNSPKSHYTIELKNINPIPLTPEILEKCGFECEYVSKYAIKYTHLNHAEIGYNWTKLSGWFARYYGPILIHIKYLHQLQNLYWCLCGEELEINI